MQLCVVSAVISAVRIVTTMSKTLFHVLFVLSFILFFFFKINNFWIETKTIKKPLKRWALCASMSVRALALVSKLPDARPSHPSFLRNHLFTGKNTASLH